MTELTTDNYPEHITDFSLDEHSKCSTGFKVIMPANTKIIQSSSTGSLVHYKAFHLKRPQTL